MALAESAGDVVLEPSILTAPLVWARGTHRCDNGDDRKDCRAAHGSMMFRRDRQLIRNMVMFSFADRG